MIPRSEGNRIEKFADHSIAVAEGFDLHAYFVEQGEVQVGERHGFVVSNMTIAFHAACCTACHDGGKVGMVVIIWITHAASVKDDGIV